MKAYKKILALPIIALAALSLCGCTDDLVDGTNTNIETEGTETYRIRLADLPQTRTTYDYQMGQAGTTANVNWVEGDEVGLIHFKGIHEKYDDNNEPIYDENNNPVMDYSLDKNRNDLNLVKGVVHKHTATNVDGDDNDYWYISVTDKHLNSITDKSGKWAIYYPYKVAQIIDELEQSDEVDDAFREYPQLERFAYRKFLSFGEDTESMDFWGMQPPTYTDGNRVDEFMKKTDILKGALTFEDFIDLTDENNSLGAADPAKAIEMKHQNAFLEISFTGTPSYSDPDWRAFILTYMKYIDVRNPEIWGTKYKTFSTGSIGNYSYLKGYDQDKILIAVPETYGKKFNFLTFNIHSENSNTGFYDLKYKKNSPLVIQPGKIYRLTLDRTQFVHHFYTNLNSDASTTYATSVITGKNGDTYTIIHQYSRDGFSSGNRTITAKDLISPDFDTQYAVGTVVDPEAMKTMLKSEEAAAAMPTGAKNAGVETYIENGKQRMAIRGFAPVNPYGLTIKDGSGNILNSAHGDNCWQQFDYYTVVNNFLAMPKYADEDTEAAIAEQKKIMLFYKPAGYRLSYKKHKGTRKTNQTASIVAYTPERFERDVNEDYINSLYNYAASNATSGNSDCKLDSVSHPDPHIVDETYDHHGLTPLGAEASADFDPGITTTDIVDKSRSNFWKNFVQTTPDFITSKINEPVRTRYVENVWTYPETLPMNGLIFNFTNQNGRVRAAFRNVAVILEKDGNDWKIVEWQILAAFCGNIEDLSGKKHYLYSFEVVTDMSTPLYLMGFHPHMNSLENQ